MGKLENSTISMTIFLMLLISFGASIGGVDALAALNSIFGPWPSIGQSVTATKNCATTDIFCNAQSVQQATSNLAAVVYYPANLFFNILGRINAFGSILTTVLFGPANGVAPIPLGTFFFFGVIVLPASYEIFRMWRGNASAGTL